MPDRCKLPQRLRRGHRLFGTIQNIENAEIQWTGFVLRILQVSANDAIETAAGRRLFVAPIQGPYQFASDVIEQSELLAADLKDRKLRTDYWYNQMVLNQLK